MDKKMTVHEALVDILQANKSLINDGASLMKALETRTSSEHWQDLALFRKALLDVNVGEVLAIADISSQESREKAETEILARLSNIMQEKLAKYVVKILMDAIIFVTERERQEQERQEREQQERERQERERQERERQEQERQEQERQEQERQEQERQEQERQERERQERERQERERQEQERQERERQEQERQERERQERERQEREQRERERQEQERQEREHQERERQERERQERERQEQERQERQERERQEQHKRYEKFSLKWLLLGLVVITIIGGIVSRNSSDSPIYPSSSTSSTKVVPATSSSTTKKSSYTEPSETSLAGIEIGMTAKELISSRSAAKSYDAWVIPGYDAYDYGKVTAIVKGDRVCALISNDSTITTKRGIHSGSSEQELKNSYGTTSTICFNDRLYEFTSNDKQKCYVGFAVGNGTVRTIKIADKNVYDFMLALYSLATYHSLITKRDYDSAYDYYLTESMKSQLGNYDDWKAGYRTTVSSEIKKINSVRKIGEAVEIAYDLEAVDNPGGTRYFTGKALIKKNGGWWAIDSMEYR